MSLLTSGRVAALLDKLHREADAADHDVQARLMAQMQASGTSVDDMVADLLAAERTDLRAAYRGHVDHFLAVSPAYGRFLYAMVRARRATRVVEFGTSMGVSTIYLAAALRDNGGGQIIGTELEPAKATRARAHLVAAGLDDLVEIRVGDALQTLQDVGGAVDVLLIDGAFSLYLPVLKLIEPQLVPGAIILGENAFARDYLDHVRDPANGYLSQSLAIDEGRGNEFTVRVG